MFFLLLLLFLSKVAQAFKALSYRSVPTVQASVSGVWTVGPNSDWDKAPATWPPAPGPERVPYPPHHRNSWARMAARCHWGSRVSPSLPGLALPRRFAGPARVTKPNSLSSCLCPAVPDGSPSASTAQYMILYIVVKPVRRVPSLPPRLSPQRAAKLLLGEILETQSPASLCR